MRPKAMCCSTCRPMRITEFYRGATGGDAGRRAGEVAPYKRDPADFRAVEASAEGVIGWVVVGTGAARRISMLGLIRAHLGRRSPFTAAVLDLIFPHHRMRLPRAAAPMMARRWRDIGCTRLRRHGAEKMRRAWAMCDAGRVAEDAQGRTPCGLRCFRRTTASRCRGPRR